MIKSAKEYAVHALLSYEGNVQYRIPPYQREYSWSKAEWEELFQDLIEAEGAHFLGTIITLDQTTDALDSNILEVIDGQQRLTTLTLLLAAIYSILKEHREELDEDTQTDLTNLGRQLIRRSDGQLRLVPQRQGHNLADYRQALKSAGLKVEAEWKPYYPSRRIAKCLDYFQRAISQLAETRGCSVPGAALTVLDAAKRAIIVKIEVATSADAFVLFESLNNRGMPLSPVDLIKNHLLAQSERKAAMGVDEAFTHWNDMLTSLGDNYATQERFLRHFYNAFKSELPDVPQAYVATRSNLIKIYETLLGHDVQSVVDALVAASKIYGRINCVTEQSDATPLDAALRGLMRVQGAPSYVLLLWLMTKRDDLELTDAHLENIVSLLISFFVRRNLTGFPQTYALARLFMTTIDAAVPARGEEIVTLVRSRLAEASAPDDEFRTRLTGRIYEDNSDVARFILATLAEDAMTKENKIDLWRQEQNRFVWTIEHILPQGENLPAGWIDMLGGREEAARVQEAHRHRLGNLTITAYNSNLGNKSFIEKRDRTDAEGRSIGYRNGLSLNADLAQRDSWTGADIQNRTQSLASRVMARFPLG